MGQYFQIAGNAILANPTIARGITYWNQVPGTLLNGVDQLDKTAKLFDGIIGGLDYYVEATPINFAAKSLIKSATRWLSASLIMRDFKFWTESKNGELSFVALARKDAFSLASITCYHIGHLFEAVKLAKDLGVSGLQQVDDFLGQVSIMGFQLSIKLIKDTAVILGGTFGLASVFSGIVMDDHLFEKLREGRIFEILTEERCVNFVNNVAKIYVVSAVVLGAPYGLGMFAFGLALGVTNAIKYVMKHENVELAKVRDYQRKQNVIDQLPKITDREAFRRPLQVAAVAG